MRIYFLDWCSYWKKERRSVNIARHAWIQVGFAWNSFGQSCNIFLSRGKDGCSDIGPPRIRRFKISLLVEIKLKKALMMIIQEFLLSLVIKYNYLEKTKNPNIVTIIMDYIANSKNRKFKKQILVFFDRIHFGTGKLPLSGKFILLLVWVLGLSLFFPWLEFEYINKEAESFTAFSHYVGYVWYLIIAAVFTVPFFLLSHTKKEKVRSIVPFRLSDAQVIVFITSIILTSLIHLLAMIHVFSQFATPSVANWLILALTWSFCIIVAAFFLSRRTKEDSIEIRHFDHQDASLNDEYAQILWRKKGKGDSDNENMVLPI